MPPQAVRLLAPSDPVLRRVVLGLGVLAVVALVAAPVPGLLDARDRAAAADVEAARDTVRPMAGNGEVPELDGDLLSARRIGEDLAMPVRADRVTVAGETLQAALGVGEPGCIVVRLDGRTIARAGTTEPLIPASVQKVLTAAAVLDVVGADERFVTQFWGPAPVDGVVDGDVHVLGGGDPMLAEQRYADSYRRQPQILTPVDQLPGLLRAAGVERIAGDLVVHDGRYDDVRYVTTWPQRYFDQHNAGPAGALTVNDGFTEWDPGRVEADDPALYAASTMRSVLAADGISLGGVRRAGDAAVPTGEGAMLLAEMESDTVGVIVQQMLRESDNNTAESLLKELGFRRDGIGSTLGGAEVVIESLARRGLDVTGVVVTDGSGLDRGNLVGCDLLADVLDQFGPDSVLGEGLAVAAGTGTLAHRYGDSDVGGRLRAKTGLLNNVNALAGFVETLDGNTLTFVQLQNGVPLNSREGLEAQDVLAEQLVAVAAGGTIEELVAAVEALDAG